MKKTYTSAIKLTEDTWRYSSVEQKEELLESLGYDSSWAKTKTINEMVKRGGGMVAKDILNLEKIYLKRHGGKVTVNWN
jgi:hypothetical protein